MIRDDAIARLRRHEDAIRAQGASALYLFGSTARDEAGPASDLDLFVDYDPRTRFSLLDLAGVKLLIERELSVVADVTTRNSLHPLLRAGIERSAIRIF